MALPKKGFYVAPVLVKEWDDAMTNKNDNSASAAGAMFIFLLLPAEIQQRAKRLCKPDRLNTQADLDAAKREFIETMSLPPEQIAYEVLQQAVIGAKGKKQSRRRKTARSGKSQ